jgi:uncharacterized membrane protein YfcA
MKLAPFFALGQFNRENLLTSAVLMPLAVATNFLGIWLVRVMPNELFYRIVYVIVLLLGLELVRNGVMGIWYGR